MGQFVFFVLFVITLLAGAFAYFTPLQDLLNPIGFIMEKSGLSSEKASNDKNAQQLLETERKGLIQAREQMDDNAREKNKFLDVVQDHQQILKDENKDPEDIMKETQEAQSQKIQDQEQFIADQKQRMQDEQNR